MGASDEKMDPRATVGQKPPSGKKISIEDGGENKVADENSRGNHRLRFDIFKLRANSLIEGSGIYKFRPDLGCHRYQFVSADHMVVSAAPPRADVIRQSHRQDRQLQPDPP